MLTHSRGDTARNESGRSMSHANKGEQGSSAVNDREYGQFMGKWTDCEHIGHFSHHLLLHVPSSQKG